MPESGPTRIRIAILALLLFGVAAYTAVANYRNHVVRSGLYELLEVVPLESCELARIGREHDGGYVVCANLLDQASVAYSYGIAGEDSFGCDASQTLDVDVHQYDCFDTTRYPCANGRETFHEECVGGAEATLDGRAFDSVPNHIARTGHAGEHVLVKMDIEGAEVESLLATPPETLATIDQLVLEIHSVHDPGTLEMVRYLTQHFHVADVHFNNFACKSFLGPFPAYVYEVLFVNKALDAVDVGGEVSFPNPHWSANDPGRVDCQAPMTGG